MTIRAYKHQALVAGRFIAKSAEDARFLLAVHCGEYLNCYETAVLEFAIGNNETVTLEQLRSRGQDFKHEMNRDWK